MKLLKIAVMVLLAGSFAACATAGETADAEGRSVVEVRVNNNVQPPRPVTVWLASQTGARSMVGTVGASEIERHRTSRVSLPGQFTLVAESNAGDRLVSDPFYLDGGSNSVEWQLATNMVRVENR